jgi:hypothetical protein
VLGISAVLSLLERDDASGLVRPCDLARHLRGPYGCSDFCVRADLKLSLRAA